MATSQAAPSQTPQGGESPQPEAQPVVIGILSAPGISTAFAEQLRRQLPHTLTRRFPKSQWQVEVQVEAMAGPPGTDVDLVQIARRRMLDRGWTLAVVLTDLPIHVGNRPVTAHVSVTLGVGVVSVPALGPIAHRDARSTNGGACAGGPHGRNLPRAASGLRRSSGCELDSAPGFAICESRSGTLSCASKTPCNSSRIPPVAICVSSWAWCARTRPWHLIAGLSRALVAALGAAAFTLTSPGVWRIANGLNLPRLLLLSIGAIAGTCILLIAVHGLLEPIPQRPGARQRVLLFNMATTLTITLGVVTHYVALFVITVLAGFALIAPRGAHGRLRLSPGGTATDRSRLSDHLPCEPGGRHRLWAARSLQQPHSGRPVARGRRGQAAASS